MTKPLLHPWLETPEALRAAERAVSVPLYKLPARAQMIGHDELFSEALSILTECALPPREEAAVVCAECGGVMPETRRRNAKYCSPLCTNRAGVRRSRQRGKGIEAPPPPAHPKTHIGSMHSWPEDQMTAYAVREVGFRLCHFVSRGQLETPASQTLANLATAATDEVTDARDVIEAWLEAKGVRCTGDESIEELAEAVEAVKQAATAVVA